MLILTDSLTNVKKQKEDQVALRKAHVALSKGSWNPVFLYSFSSKNKKSRNIEKSRKKVCILCFVPSLQTNNIQYNISN